MKILTVALDDRSYPIYIGEKLLSDESLLTRHIKSKQVVIVSNEIVAPLYLQTVQQHLSAYEVASVILPDGEQYKTLNKETS